MFALLLATAFAESPPQPPGPASVHQLHRQLELGALRDPSALPLPMPLPDPTPGPDARVYGYMPYWAGSLDTMPWDHLSDIALFSADVDTAGNLSNTSRWGDIELAVATASAYDVKVHLCVTNFDRSELEVLLGSTAAKTRLIDALRDEVQSTGAHGVNIDFENLPSSRREEMVEFIIDLEAAVGEVVIATPSVDWSDAWDYGALTDHADLFIMGYGYHWSGSDNAGPVDPLFAGSLWAPWTLEWSVTDYKSAGADPERIILGLPLYGYSWPTPNDSVPGTNTGTGTSVVWSAAQTQAALHGRNWESQSLTPWYYDGTKQTWYSDVPSVSERAIYAIDVEEVGGIGFWALGYDNGDEALWDAVRERTVFDVPDDPDVPPADPEFVAVTGQPFLAYVGDVAILSGSASTGPSGLSLRYEWTQTAGPPVDLVLIEPPLPKFEITEVGTHAFSLRVGDGTRWSAPVTAHVIVLDPAAGRRHEQCGCVTTGSSAWGMLTLLGLLTIRRRNRDGETPRERS